MKRNGLYLCLCLMIFALALAGCPLDESYLVFPTVVYTYNSDSVLPDYAYTETLTVTSSGLSYLKTGGSQIQGFACAVRMYVEDRIALRDAVSKIKEDDIPLYTAVVIDGESHSVLSIGENYTCGIRGKYSGINSVDELILLLDGFKAKYLERPPQSINATITWIELEGGFWGIIGDEGQYLYPINLTDEYKIHDLPIRLTYKELNSFFGFHMWGPFVEIQEISLADG